MNPDDVRLPVACPWCGQQPGDLGICWECGEVLVFVDQTRARRPTDVEQIEFDADERIKLARVGRRESSNPFEAVAFTRSILGGGS